MKSSTILGRALAILFFAACLHLEAADQRETNASAKTVQPQSMAAWMRRLPEFRADGIPLEGVVEQLRDRFPELNFVIKTQGDIDAEPSTKEVSVTVRLNSVTLVEILKALELATSKPIQITGGPNERLVVFERQRNPKPAVQIEAENRILTRVFALSEYLAGRSDNEVDKAIAQLWDVMDVTRRLLKESGGMRDFEPKFHLHRGTKLLIVTGRSDELVIMDEIVTRLQESARVWKPNTNKQVGEITKPKVTTQ